MGSEVTLVSVVILAAGESKRMGELKQLIPLGQYNILQETIDNSLSSAVSEVIVVVGHRAEEIINSIGSRPVKVALNPEYRQGMRTSIVAGLKLVSNESQGFMIALADQPFIDRQTIDYLIEEFSTSEKGIVIPVYQNRRGHPVIFAKKYRKELLALEGDGGAKPIITRHPDDILETIVNCEGIMTDIDTLDGYQLANSQLDRRQNTCQKLLKTGSAAGRV